MTPEAALDRVMHCLDRAHDKGFRAKAFQRARDVVRTTDPSEIEERAASGTLKKLDGIGDSSAKVIMEALAGEVPHYLLQLEATTQVPITPEGERYRQALRGDCHLHSTWSDGGAEIEEMAATAIALGHEYMVLTDHSARLTIAHGLDRERLERQLADIEALNSGFDDFRILTGMEVDIFEDGTLDLDDDLLERLDVVVASVHSKLRMERQPMTERMIVAVANPHVDILGHCTGRMIGRRPPSTFDADYVFAACKQFGTAVEINCRPGAPRPAARAARRRHRLRVLVLDRHRRPRHRPARVAAPRVRPGRRAGGADRTGHQHDVGRRPAGLDRDAR